MSTLRLLTTLKLQAARSSTAPGHFRITGIETAVQGSCTRVLRLQGFAFSLGRIDMGNGNSVKSA